MVKIVSLIPARGGSKRIPRKNIKPLNGKPMIYYTIKASLDSKVDETWVSTEDEEIKKIAQSFGAKVLDRPEKYAQDTSSTEKVMLHFTENVDYDILVTLELTYPLMTKDDINGSIDKMIKGNCDSLLSLTKQKMFRWDKKEDEAVSIDYIPKRRPRMQEYDGYLVEEGGIFLTKKELLLKEKCRLGGKIGYYILDHRSVDVDNEVDLKIAETLMKWYT